MRGAGHPTARVAGIGRVLVASGMDSLYQADLARHIAEVERHLQLVYRSRGELLEALNELNEAARKLHAELDNIRQLIGSQSGKEPHLSREIGRLKKSQN